jgi:hypothetical protein
MVALLRFNIAMASLVLMAMSLALVWFENVAAPQIAIDYWRLGPDARLKDVVIAVRVDEAGHRDVNHRFVDELSQG